MRVRLRHRATGLSGRPGWLLSPDALIDMDFAGARYFGKQLGDLTVTRASAGYAQDQAGNWQAFGANIPRVTNRGLLVESARTNAIRNNAMQGAVAGTPGTAPANWQIATALNGLVRSIVGIGTEAGIDYIDVRLAGTTTATTAFDINPESWNAVPAAAGQQWSGSAFLRVVGGSTTGLTTCYLWLYELSSSAGFLATSGGQITPTPTMARLIGTRTLSNASVAFVRPILQLQFAAGASVDITLRIGWPQLEQGGYATSPIRTTGAAQTRAADLISFPVSGVPNSFSVICSAAHAPALGQGLLCNLKTSGSPHVMFGSSGSPNLGRMEIGDGQGWSVNRSNTLLTPGQRFKSAFAYTTNSSRLSVNGGAVTSNIPSSVVVPSLIYLGSASWGALQWGGYIERVTLVPAFLTNTELQGITQ